MLTQPVGPHTCSPLFPHNQTYLRSLMNHVYKRPVHEGDFFLHEGDVARSVFIVHSGMLEVSSLKWPAGPPRLRSLASSPKQYPKAASFKPRRHGFLGHSSRKEDRHSASSTQSSSGASQRAWMGGDSLGAMSVHLPSTRNPDIAGEDEILVAKGEVEDEESTRRRGRVVLVVGEGAVLLEDEVLEALRGRKEDGLLVDSAFELRAVTSCIKARSLTEDVVLLRLKMKEVLNILKDFAPLRERLWEGLESGNGGQEEGEKQIDVVEDKQGTTGKEDGSGNRNEPAVVI